jgi:hypothetical protein
MSERSGGMAALIAAELLFVGFIGGSLIKGATDNVDGKVRDAQITNAQLQDQLGQSHDLQNLIVDPSKHTFSFQEGAENCTGKYEGDKNQAHAVGQLACTTSVPAVK